jgi:outer membrane protein OmpA-like peptidoglycan-associated protein
MFDLGSAVLKPEFKPAIAQAAATAKARKSIKVCVVGQTDKLGDKNYNAKLAQARAQAVAGELIHAGYPAKDVIIASNPEAFGNLSFGGNDASEMDRRVTIVLR